MYSYPIRVYYSDTDCGGIVYHARYLDFAEHARTEMLRDIGAKHGLEGSQSSLTATLNLAFVVKSINVDYEKPAHLDDLLEVRTELESAKRSLVFATVPSLQVLHASGKGRPINSETLSLRCPPGFFPHSGA